MLVKERNPISNFKIYYEKSILSKKYIFNFFQNQQPSTDPSQPTPNAQSPTTEPSQQPTQNAQTPTTEPSQQPTSNAESTEPQPQAFAGFPPLMEGAQQLLRQIPTQEHLQSITGAVQNVLEAVRNNPATQAYINQYEGQFGNLSQQLEQAMEGFAQTQVGFYCEILKRNLNFENVYKL